MVGMAVVLDRSKGMGRGKGCRLRRMASDAMAILGAERGVKGGRGGRGSISVEYFI